MDFNKLINLLSGHKNFINDRNLKNVIQAVVQLVYRYEKIACGRFWNTGSRLEKEFNGATSRAAAEYWIWDGIHPAYSGHEMISREWLQQVSKKLPFLNNTN